MLRISIRESKTERLLVLEGKLIIPWTSELIKVASKDPENRPVGDRLVIDLSEVTDISLDGEEALYFLMVKGAHFRGGGVFIKQVLEQLAQRVHPEDSNQK